MSIEALERLSRDPYDLVALVNLSHTYVSERRVDEARPLLARADELQPEALLAPDYPVNTEYERIMLLAAITKLIATLSVCHWQIGNFNTAHSYAKLVRQQYPTNFGLISLALGDYETGWAYWDCHNTATAGLPWWTGEDDQHVLVIDEDYGYGDTIMMARFLPILAKRCRVSLRTRSPLRRLMQNSFPAIEIGEEGDCQVRLCSLPRMFGVRPDTIPGEPYLRADPDDCQRWHTKLAQYGCKIGLCWTGSTVHQMDHLRSICDLSVMLPLKDADTTFVSLANASQIPDFPMVNVELSDFADTAALLTTLDLVISVDTAVINLAGAMGVPGWLLNYSPGDWRWGIDGERSPWYPSVRIFRQPAFGDWPSVIRDVSERLRNASVTSAIG